MPFIPVPNGIMVELIYNWQSQRVENVYHVTTGSPATLNDLANVTNIFRSWENVTARGARNNTISLVQIDARGLDSENSPALQTPVLPAISGALGGSPLATFVTLAIRHTTGLAGRSFRGRTYFLGLGQAAAPNGDNVSQATADNFAGLYNTLRTTLLANGFTFCVASKYSGVVIVNGRRRAVPRTSGILTPVLASICERYLDTNRHRKLPFQA